MSNSNKILEESFNAQKEFNCKKILIGGESSGANLALHALIQTIPEESPSPFCGYIAVNGLYECSQDRNITQPDNHIGARGSKLEQKDRSDEPDDTFGQPGL